MLFFVSYLLDYSNISLQKFLFTTLFLSTTILYYIYRR